MAQKIAPCGLPPCRAHATAGDPPRPIMPANGVEAFTQTVWSYSTMVGRVANLVVLSSAAPDIAIIDQKPVNSTFSKTAAY